MEFEDFKLTRSSGQAKYIKVDVHNYVRWRKYKGKKEYSAPTITALLKAIHSRVWKLIIEETWFYDTIIGSFYVKASRGKVRVFEDGKVIWKENDRWGGRKPFITWEKRTGRSRNILNYIFRPIQGSKDDTTGVKGLWGHVDSKNGDYVGNYI